MKAKLIAIGSVAALLASPLALADKSAEGPAVCGMAEEGPTDSPGDEVVEITVIEEGEVSGEPVEDGEPICDKDPAVCEEGHVPVDWVKRGESELENPDVIFYTTADGGASAPVVTKSEIELGQDDKAAIIEAKGTAAPQVKHEKKGPVALVKKGRVFLR